VPGRIPNEERDIIAHAYRERIVERLGTPPFLHQRKWWLATQGLELLENVEDVENGVTVRLPDDSVVQMGYGPRDSGVAHVIGDLGAYKSGKSYGSALWASGFGAVPGAKVTLVGSEYSICEPEFNYIVDFLLSSDGMGLRYDNLVNRPKQGDMYLKLRETGAVFEAKSWERKDALKGKEVDVYLYCEAYQLPGLECFMSVRQNLKARNGYAIFPTTPDRPWLQEIHDHGHGDPKYPEWQCVCSVPRSQNPYTFDSRIEEQDKSLMTSEKFLIAHFGMLGDYVGKVYNYQKGSRVFNRITHPDLFDDSGDVRFETLRIPPNWTVVGGADTGGFYSAGLIAFDPDGTAFVLQEWPNYRYLSGAPERDDELTIPRWAHTILSASQRFGGHGLFLADRNSQFKHELKNYGVNLWPGVDSQETRTEIAREYLQQNKVFFAPWLTVLPFEIENAAWPEEASATGAFKRVKDRDHTLDWFEHILGKRPLGVQPKKSLIRTFAEQMGWRTQSTNGNVHVRNR
jgi:hypothetical protein